MMAPFLALASFTFAGTQSCSVRRNMTFAAMQPVDGAAATSPEACCQAMLTAPRCNQSGIFVCRYFLWKDPCCYPFPNNCEFHTAAGPFLPQSSDSNLTTSGWLPGAPSPTDPPAPSKVVSAQYDVSTVGGLGLEWEGVGAISGGGATTKLLMDYDPAVARDILDYLFLPNFGLSLQILKVEIGGDTDATEGAESSHMHSAADPGNYERGYEWWLMREAKQRNPAIKLYGLSWGFPGWLNANATAHAAADPKGAFVNLERTANYTVQWLLGAKREHGLDIDYVGLWNERSPPSEFHAVLADAVAAAGLGATTTVLGPWPIEHYGGSGVAEDPQNCTQYPWRPNNVNASRWEDEDGSISDGRSARCLARIVNRNYASFCKTATFQWHLISSFYDYLPWARCGVAVANTPWSGGYEITSPTWALAHTTQFAPPVNGVQYLAGGGSLVTRVSPDGSDFSIVLEKMDAGRSQCARGNNPPLPVNKEVVTIHLHGHFASVDELQVWYSDLSQDSSAHGNNPEPEKLFVAQPPLKVSSGGTITLTLRPDELYTLTTLKTGRKGAHDSASRVPAHEPLPLPHVQNFDGEALDKPGRLWYAQMGAWEIHPSGGSSGRELRQVATVWPTCWNSNDCDPPKVWFGPAIFSDDFGARASLSVLLQDHGNIWLALSPFGQQSMATVVTLCTNGTWVVGSASGTGLELPVGEWQRVQVSRAGGRLSATVGGRPLANVSIGNPGPPGGNFTLRLMLSHYFVASVDDFRLEAQAAASPQASAAA